MKSYDEEIEEMGTHSSSKQCALQCSADHGRFESGSSHTADCRDPFIKINLLAGNTAGIEVGCQEEGLSFSILIFPCKIRMQ